MIVPMATLTASFALATALSGSPTSSAVGAGSLISPNPELIRQYCEGMLSSTSSANTAVPFMKVSGSLSPVTKFDAYELFGEMRSSTPEEQAAYKRMKAQLSKSVGLNVFDLC